ncbi:MAG: type II secretion system F family protein [Acidimicrobiales bacterium]
MTALGGVFVGVVLAVGCLLIGAGLTPVERGGRRTSWVRSVGWRRVAAVVLGAVVAFLSTGWPAAAVFAGAVAFIVPTMVRARRQRDDDLAMTDALAGWAEMLRDTIVSHAGLREAVAVTAEVAPPAVRPAVQRLAARAEHESLSVGLSRFAEEVADPVADLIVAALSVAADGQARNVPALLGGIAAAARAEAQMRLRVEAGRARTYSSSRALVVITFGLSVSLLLFAPTFMSPFATLWGQLVLMVVGGLFAGALWGLVALGRSEEVPRILAGVAERWDGVGR